jgi:lysophospholipase
MTQTSRKIRWLITALIGCTLLSACEKEDPLESPKPIVILDELPGPPASAFSSENTLAGRYRTHILPGYEAGISGTFKGVKGVSVHYRYFEATPTQGTIVLLPGRSEPILKYAEVIADLKKQGYSVYALDHRGQGASGRMTADPELGYVEYFSDYVQDLGTLVSQVVRPKHPKKLFLLAHSMGGAVGAFYLESNPGVFEAAVLSSPMMELHTGKFTEDLAFSVAGTNCSRGDGKKYALGQAPYDPNINFNNIAENDVTHSRARFDLKIEQMNERPELRVGGVSYRWLCESFLATSRLQNLGKNSITPTLLFQAGSDLIVKPAGQDKYCKNSKRCQKSYFEGAFHEILMESDSIRNNALSKAVRYFNYFGEE